MTSIRNIIKFTFGFEQESEHDTIVHVSALLVDDKFCCKDLEVGYRLQILSLSLTFM